MVLSGRDYILSITAFAFIFLLGYNPSFNSRSILSHRLLIYPGKGSPPPQRPLPAVPPPLGVPVCRAAARKGAAYAGRICYTIANPNRLPVGMGWSRAIKNSLLYQISPWRARGQRREPSMEIRLAQTRDIGPWMRLAHQVRDIFPRLETREAMGAHREAVLGFIEASAAVCAAEGGRVVGAFLFSKDPTNTLCFLGADPSYRRRHIGQKMVSFTLPLMDAGKDVRLITCREGDPNGIAARAFYRCLGFSARKLLEAYPAQEFVLKR